MPRLHEGKATFHAGTAPVASKAMGVFYNPIMRLNRDLTLLLLGTWKRDKLRIADPLAGSGIRSVRMLLELEKKKIAHIAINDASSPAVTTIKKNLKLNKTNKKTTVKNDDANTFLLDNKSFDYIDIDPFGYPGPFIESAVRKVTRGGIIAVTATDTAALAGTAPRACLRKYWATPLRDACMHETGLRILIRRVQLVAASYGKAAVPVLAYAKEHYYRAFFSMEKGRKKADRVMQQHGTFRSAGPLWLGALWDATRLKKMHAAADGEAKTFLDTLLKEAAITSVGFYDVHALCSRLKTKSVPPLQTVIAALRKTHKAARTHFSNTGIRTTASQKDMEKLLKKLC